MTKIRLHNIIPYDSNELIKRKHKKRYKLRYYMKEKR